MLKKRGIIIGAIVFIALSIVGLSVFLLGTKDGPMEKYMKDNNDEDINRFILEKYD